MELPLIDNQEFKNKNYTAHQLTKGEYSFCTFNNCNFENSDISNITFLECDFIGCNISNANVMRTTFNDVTFSNCKLVGVLFQNCNTFLLSFSFNDSILNLSSFYQLKLPELSFQIARCTKLILLRLKPKMWLL